MKLDKPLKVGDKVHLQHGDDSFEQAIESMQLDHKSISDGKKGDEVAIKVDSVAKEGTIVVR